MISPATLPTHDNLSPSVKARNLAMNWLLTTFPKAFDLRNRRPLKPEILTDIIEASHENLPNQDALESALRYYMHWGSYLNGMTMGARFIDLHGVAIGMVTEGMQQEAKTLLAKAQKQP